MSESLYPWRRINCTLSLFESPRCRTIIQALQPNLRDDMVLKEKEVRQITNQNCSRQLLTSHTAQRAVWQPIERSPTAPSEPLRSANLHATHSRGGCIDANASRVLATHSGGGRNCPHFSHDNTVPQPFSNESRLHPASARSASRVAKRCTRYFTLRTESSYFALVHQEFSSNNIDAETLLGKLQIESNRSRPAVQMGVARPTGPLRLRAAKGFQHCARIFFP